MPAGAHRLAPLLAPPTRATARPLPGVRHPPPPPLPDPLPLLALRHTGPPSHSLPARVGPPTLIPLSLFSGLSAVFPSLKHPDDSFIPCQCRLFMPRRRTPPPSPDFD
jgi:hypothetical protein